MPRSAERVSPQQTTTGLTETAEFVRHASIYEEPKPESIPARGDCKWCGSPLCVDGACPSGCSLAQRRRPKRYSW